MTTPTTVPLTLNKPQGTSIKLAITERQTALVLVYTPAIWIPIIEIDGAVIIKNHNTAVADALKHIGFETCYATHALESYNRLETYTQGREHRLLANVLTLNE